jgi:hypothetical protein
VFVDIRNKLARNLFSPEIGSTMGMHSHGRHGRGHIGHRAHRVHHHGHMGHHNRFGHHHHGFGIGKSNGTDLSEISVLSSFYLNDVTMRETTGEPCCKLVRQHSDLGSYQG